PHEPIVVFVKRHSYLLLVEPLSKLASYPFLPHKLTSLRPVSFLGVLAYPFAKHDPIGMTTLDQAIDLPSYLRVPFTLRSFANPVVLTPPPIDDLPKPRITLAT